ncbi:MAG TPA: tetratricopeptide repeat protein [Anaerolineales bacterium]|nr:tetratricopeptide repeat protein [Anaerolineales bacterium]
MAKDPNYAKAYYNLGNLLSDQPERYAEAEDAYRQAIAKDPNFAQAYSNLGILLRKLGRYAEAEDVYRQAIAIDPNDAQAYNNLVILLRVTGREKEAIPLLEKMLEINANDFNSYLGIASIRKSIGEPVPEQMLEKARQLIPAEDWYNRACLESVSGNADTAFEYLQKAAQQKKFNPAWAWQDPDLQWIRGDPRFAEIVGKKA